MHSLDGISLPIKQLKGEKHVEEINLSGGKYRQKLGVASAVVIASLIGSNTATKSLKCAIAF